MLVHCSVNHLQSMAEQLRPGDRDSREATPALHQGMRTSCDGVTYLLGRPTLSFQDEKCRDSNPFDCPGTCCSKCTNPLCDWPRGMLYFRRGKYNVHFKLVDGHILCRTCADFLFKHGIVRSEASQSDVRAAKSLQSSANIIQTNLSRPLRPSSRPDREWGPTKSGESASCDLCALLSSVCVTC